MKHCNRELSALIQQFPKSGTKYDVTITLDKETDFSTDLQLQSQTGATAGKRAITPESDGAIFKV